MENTLNPTRRIFQWAFNFLYQKSSRSSELKAFKDRLTYWERLNKVRIFCRSVDEWHSFIDSRHCDLPILLDRLKLGVDEESRKQVDLFFDRYRHVFPPSRFEGHVFFDPQKILTAEEIEAAKQLEEFLRKPLPYLFPGAVEINEPHLFWSEIGLVHIPSSDLLRIKNGDVIDGGAYCGDSALVFSKYNPRKIHCFEILPENLELLNETAKLNGVSELFQPVQLGLGSKAAKQKLIRRKGASHAMDAMLQAEHLEIPEGWELICDVPVCSIDEYVKENSLNPTLIKLDVEGSEFDVISGALETIRRFKPLLLISVYHNPRDFFEIKPMVSQANPDYKFKFRYLCPTSPSNEFMMIAY
jgi:FkbM family methyltransferase